MHTQAEAFLQRIRAYPDDDAPRLIFADWLDERGDPRGEFIRVQLALARPGEEAADRDDTRSELRGREQKLLAAHRAEWTAPLDGLATGAKFHRGFVEEVNVGARVLVARANELFATGPIRHIHLLDGGSYLAAALECPFLSRLNALSIHASYRGEPLARAVAQSRHLSGLKSLHLTRNKFEADAVAHLATSPVLANLEELDLGENELGELGARTLAASPHLGGLRRLELKVNQIGPMGAEVVAASTRLPNLHKLGLAENEIGSPRLQSLDFPQCLLRVPVLDLSWNGLDAAGLEVILTRPPEVRLQDLTLNHNNELGNDGARVIAASPHLDGVKALRLIGCGIDDDGARVLAESSHLNGLVTLDLSNNPINNSGFQPFLDTQQLQNLRQLVATGITKRTHELIAERFHHRRR